MERKRTRKRTLRNTTHHPRSLPSPRCPLSAHPVCIHRQKGRRKSRDRRCGLGGSVDNPNNGTSATHRRVQVWGLICESHGHGGLKGGGQEGRGGRTKSQHTGEGGLSPRGRGNMGALTHDTQMRCTQTDRESCADCV